MAKWFRFYSEAAYHREVQELPPALFKFWVNAMCLANAHESRGTLPPVKDIAYALHLTAKQASLYLDKLTLRGLVDGETGAIHNWKKWQPDSDARATEGRVRGDIAASARRVRGVEEKEKREDTDSDKDSETEGEGERAAPFILYEKAFGVPVPNGIQADRLIALEEERGPACLEHCMVEAALAGADLRYAEKVMERHKREGCEPSAAPRKVKPSANGVGDTQAEWLERRYREARVKEATP